MPIHTEAITSRAPSAPVLTKDSSRYDEARRAWNLSADLRPAAVCVTRTADEIRGALRYARDRGLGVAPMTTGHMATSMPPLDDTLLLRFGHPAVNVDPRGRRARIWAGTSWSDVLAAVTPHGLTAVHGSSASVGAIGFLLGGGLSFYSRRHGLAANHVRSFTVVTADGELRLVDAEHDPDLFWALRGGGGGLAVVLTAELDLLPYREVHAGSLLFAIDDAPRVLRGWRDWTRGAPDSVTSSLRTVSIPPIPPFPDELRGATAVRIDALSLNAGDAADFEEAMRDVAPPTAGGFAAMPAAAAARFNDDPAEPAPGLGGGGELLRDLDDDAIDAYLRVTGAGSPLFVAELRHLGGALAEAPAGSGVRGRLEGSYVTLAGGVPDMPAPAAELHAAIDRFVAALKPWSTGLRFGSFAIEPGVTIEDCIPADSLDRLTRIRERVDPGRLFVAPHGLG